MQPPFALVVAAAVLASPLSAQDPAPAGPVTFQLTSAPDFLGGVPVGATHPLYANAATTAALRRDLAAGLTRRGYQRARGGARLLVVYHVATPSQEDFTDWDYQWAWRPQWARGSSAAGGVNLTPREYSQGGLVVDLVDSRSGAILWRSQAVTASPDDARLYARELRRTVATILAAAPEPSALWAAHPGGTGAS